VINGYHGLYCCLLRVAIISVMRGEDQI
jgi:hypothetical protein